MTNWCLRILQKKSLLKHSSLTEVVCSSQHFVHTFKPMQRIHLKPRMFSPLRPVAIMSVRGHFYKDFRLKNFLNLRRKFSTETSELENVEELFRKSVYATLKQNDVTPSDVLMRCKDFANASISLRSIQNSNFLGFGIQNNLDSMKEFNELLSYFTEHRNCYNAHELVNLFISLKLLKVNPEYPLILDLEAMLSDPKYPHPLDISTIGKLARIWSYHNHPSLLFCRSVIPKLRVFFEGDGFSSEENKSVLNAIYQLSYFFSNINPEWLHLMAQKILSIVCCKETFNNDDITTDAQLLKFGIVSVLRMKNTREQKGYYPFYEIADVIYNEFLLLLNQKFDQFSLIEVGMLSRAFHSKGNSRFHKDFSAQFHTASPLPVEKVKNLVYKTLNEKENLSIEELLKVMSCVIIIKHNLEFRVWSRLEQELKFHMHEVQPYHLDIFLDLFTGTMPAVAWQTMKNVCSDLLYNYLQKLSLDSYTDKQGLPITEEFVMSCGHFLTHPYYEKYNFFQFLRRKFWHGHKIFSVGNRNIVADLSVMLPVYLKRSESLSVPQEIFEKSISVMPSLNVHLLSVMLSVINKAVPSESIILGVQEQLAQLQNVGYINLMRLIEDADLIELLQILLKTYPLIYFQHYTAEERLFERLEEKCSLDPDVSFQMEKLLVLFSRKKSSDTYRPKLVEFFANYFLQNQHTMDNRHFLDIVNIVKCSATHLPCQEEFNVAACNVLEDNFDQLSLRNQVYALWMLSYLQVFPTECLMKVFSLDYLAKVDRVLADENENSFVKSTLSSRMMELNRSVVLDCPELKLVWLKEPFLDDLQPDNHNQYRGNQLPYSHKYTELQILLEEVLGGENYVQANVSTYYLYNFDFECLVLPSQKKAVSYSEVLDSRHSDSVQRVAINYLTKKEYFLFSRKLKEQYLMKKRHLQLLGYKVIEIPHYEWNSMALTNKEDSKDYLKEKIFGW